MNPKTTRIALTDRALQMNLQRLYPGAEFITCNPETLGELVGQANLFLLDDNTAIRFLGTRSEDAWPSIVVTVGEDEPLPASFRQGLVDDLLVLPPRALDIERMLSAHETMQALREIEHSSRSVSGLVKQLQEDISLAQKIQRRLIREKFPSLGALAVKSKYWCGLKSGGDYFDFFEIADSNHAGLIVSNSSSYSLSTHLIGSLMQFSVHMGLERLEHPEHIVQALYDKLKEGMKEKDRLSLLYGILDRKTYSFRFVGCGDVFLAKSGKGGKIQWGAKGERPQLSLSEGKISAPCELELEPGDRMMVCSGGWSESLGQPITAFMEELLGKQLDSNDLVKEMAFRLRRKLEKESDEPVKAEDEFPMPPHDCSVLVFDLAPNVLRLAK